MHTYLLFDGLKLIIYPTLQATYRSQTTHTQISNIITLLFAQT